MAKSVVGFMPAVHRGDAGLLAVRVLSVPLACASESRAHPKGQAGWLQDTGGWGMGAGGGAMWRRDAATVVFHEIDERLVSEENEI